KKKQEISELQAGLDDADILIRKMDLEARSLQPSLKATLLAKLREYKSDLNKLKREVKKLTLPNSNQFADEDLESGMGGTHAASANKRERLTMSTERLNQSTDRIMESRRAALETEDLGISILEDLHQQRETLLHSHKKARHTLHLLLHTIIISPIFLVCPFQHFVMPNLMCVWQYRSAQTKLAEPDPYFFYFLMGWSKLNYMHDEWAVSFYYLQLSDVDSAIDKAKKVLTSMTRRMSRNKWIVGSIIAALILAIIVILYFKIFH
ncbi:hypothetical protein RD792_006654, partial [Penstemon davidsonii]